MLYFKGIPLANPCSIYLFIYIYINILRPSLIRWPSLSRCIRGIFDHINHEAASEEDSRLIDIVMLVTQRPHATGLQQERRSILQRLLYPAHGECTENMPMGDDQYV